MWEAEGLIIGDCRSDCVRQEEWLWNAGRSHAGIIRRKYMPDCAMWCMAAEKKRKKT